MRALFLFSAFALAEPPPTLQYLSDVDAYLKVKCDKNGVYLPKDTNVVYLDQAIRPRICSPKLIASIHRCDENGCEVLLPDGTKGKTKKWPVEFAKVHPEVCQP